MSSDVKSVYKWEDWDQEHQITDISSKPPSLWRTVCAVGICIFSLLSASTLTLISETHHCTLCVEDYVIRGFPLLEHLKRQVEISFGKFNQSLPLLLTLRVTWTSSSSSGGWLKLAPFSLAVALNNQVLTPILRFKIKFWSCLLRAYVRGLLYPQTNQLFSLVTHSWKCYCS